MTASTIVPRVDKQGADALPRHPILRPRDEEVPVVAVGIRRAHEGLLGGAHRAVRHGGGRSASPRDGQSSASDRTTMRCSLRMTSARYRASRTWQGPCRLLRRSAFAGAGLGWRGPERASAFPRPPLPERRIGHSQAEPDAAARVARRGAASPRQTGWPGSRPPQRRGGSSSTVAGAPPCELVRGAGRRRGSARGPSPCWQRPLWSLPLPSARQVY